MIDIEQLKIDILKYGLEHNPLMFAWKNEDIQKVVNGCGPGYTSQDLSFTEKLINHVFYELIPNHCLFVNFKQACCIHDFDYEVGKTQADKDEADKRLERNMRRLIKIQAPTVADEIDQIMPSIYYEFVHLFGGYAFDHKNKV